MSSQLPDEIYLVVTKRQWGPEVEMRRTPEEAEALKAKQEVIFREVSVEKYLRAPAGEPACPFDFAHTKTWCGYEGCRES